MLKVANLRFTWHELQVYGNVLVRLLVQMAVVPERKALAIGPVGNKPDFLGPVERAEDFHAYKAGLLIHQVRTTTEGLFDLRGLVISDDEFAERDKSAGGLSANRLSRHGVRSRSIRRFRGMGSGRLEVVLRSELR